MARLMNEHEMKHRVALAALDISILKYRRFIVWRKRNSKETIEDRFLGNSTCALCYVFTVYKIEENMCVLCPYFEFYGFKCDSAPDAGHWIVFAFNPTIANAEKMISALQNIKNALEDSGE